MGSGSGPLRSTRVALPAAEGTASSRGLRTPRYGRGISRGQRLVAARQPLVDRGGGRDGGVSHDALMPLSPAARGPRSEVLLGPGGAGAAGAAGSRPSRDVVARPLLVLLRLLVLLHRLVRRRALTRRIGVYRRRQSACATPIANANAQAASRHAARMAFMVHLLVGFMDLHHAPARPCDGAKPSLARRPPARAASCGMHDHDLRPRPRPAAAHQPPAGARERRRPAPAADRLRRVGRARDSTPRGGTGPRCPRRPAGPFPGDGSNGPNVLTESGVVRSDITKSFGDASGRRRGRPGRRSTLTLLDVAGGGSPLAGAAVYLWHCDRAGRYSLYDDAIADENYLRGVQESDADGKLRSRRSSRPPTRAAGRTSTSRSTRASTRRRRRAQAPDLAARAAPGRRARRSTRRDGYEQSAQNLAGTSLERTWCSATATRASSRRCRATSAEA